MPTNNVDVILDGTWEKMVNTAQGGYHHIASNPYATISLLAVIGLVVLVLVILGIALIAKSNQAQQIKLPPEEPTYKYETKTVVQTTTSKPKRSIAKKVIKKQMKTKKKK